MNTYIKRTAIIVAATLLAVWAFAARQRSEREADVAEPVSEPVDRPDVSRLREVGEAIEASYTSTLAAFATYVEEAEYATHDANAQRDAEQLQQVFSSIRSELAPELAESCESLIEQITSAQLQLMAFAINRKNRGLPDSAQTETEIADRNAFRGAATPLYERVKTYLNQRGAGV